MSTILSSSTCSSGVIVLVILVFALLSSSVGGGRLCVCSGDGVAFPPQRFSLSEVFDSFVYLIAPLRKNATRQRPVWCSNAMRRVVVREVEE